MFNNIKEMINYCDKQGVEIIDFKVVDMKGRWHRLSITRQKLDEDIMKKGIGFDGSSYGFLTVEKSDMVMIPDLSSCYLDYHKEHKTIVAIADIYFAPTESAAENLSIAGWDVRMPGWAERKRSEV